MHPQTTVATTQAVAADLDQRIFCRMPQGEQRILSDFGRGTFFYRVRPREKNPKLDDLPSAKRIKGEAGPG